MTTRWFEIALPLPAAVIDEGAALLDWAGFGGVEVRERIDGTELVVVVEVRGESEGDDDDGSHDQALEAEIARAVEAVAILGPGEPRATELDPKAWTENWKRHFARRTFGGRIEVRPPWEDASPESSGLVSLVINPGMAFGTGLHETTAGCLELLVGEVRPGMTVADVGCGSGILAVAAARLGATSVLATDVDPLAVEATRENVDANGVASVVTVELEPGEVGVPEWETDARPGLAATRDASSAQRPEPNGATSGGFTARGEAAFDLVVANILAETLVEMRDSLAGAVRPGGVLVLSGIEARRLNMVEEAFIGPGWTRGRSLPMGDWVSMSLHRAERGA